MQNNPPAETIDSLLQIAQDQANRGQFGEAAKAIQRALNIDPRAPRLLYAAAIIATRLGNFDEAEKFARDAVQAAPVAGHVLALADVLKEKAAYDEALKYYLLILQKLPKDPQSLIGTAEIYEQTGRRTLAINQFEAALAAAPQDMNLFRRFSKLVPFRESARAFAALERARPSDDAPIGLRLDYAGVYVTWKEAAERASRGLPSGAQSLSDRFFHFAIDERDRYEAMVDSVLSNDPSNVHAATAKATCLLVRGKRKDAEKYFKIRATAKPDTLYSNVVFNDEFYKTLENKTDDDLFGHFPDVTYILDPVFDDRAVIFLSCDYKYFNKFAKTLLLSINSAAKQPQIHMHIMDAPEQELSAVKKFTATLNNTKIAVTIESPGMRERGMDAARHYYHAIRFIRLYQSLLRHKRPLWQTDVDGLVRNDPWQVFDAIGDADVALWGHTGRWEPWNQFNASMTGICPTEKGIAFSRLVAAYIAHFHSNDNLHWGIDQLATYSVYEYLVDQGRAPRATTLPDAVIDSECRDSSIIWSNGGISKFHPLKLSAEGTAQVDSPRVKYLEYLKRFETQT